MQKSQNIVYLRDATGCTICCSQRRENGNSKTKLIKVDLTKGETSCTDIIREKIKELPNKPYNTLIVHIQGEGDVDILDCISILVDDFNQTKDLSFLCVDTITVPQNVEPHFKILFPKASSEDGNEKLLRKRIDELEGKTFAFITRSLYVSANVGDKYMSLEDGAFDVFLTEVNKPAVVFSVLRKDDPTDAAKDYISYLVKKIVTLIRTFTRENFSAAFGLLLPSDLKSKDAFHKAILKITRDTAKLCIPTMLAMPIQKQANIVKAFVSGVALTNSVFSIEDIPELWFLTLSQFQILTENLRCREVSVATHPSSGCTTLSLEVVKRLERSGPSLLISDDDQFVNKIRKSQTPFMVLTPQELTTKKQCLDRVENIVANCDTFPVNMKQFANKKAVWTFSKYKEFQPTKWVSTKKDLAGAFSSLQSQNLFAHQTTSEHTSRKHPGIWR